MKKSARIILIVLGILALIGFVLLGIFISNVVSISKSVNFDKEKLLTHHTQVAILDDQNNDITKTSNVVRAVVRIDDLPSFVPDSFVSIEDKRFFSHSGLDYKRIVKAMINNVKSGEFAEGASTISQQLIKNTHLSHEKTVERKFKEMVLTKKLEKTLSKKDILETYLNVIYFGEGAYGIEEAANTYFSKPATQLEIGEAAMLAAIIKSPATYSPIYNYENATARRNLVLKLMYENNKINSSQFQNEINVPITLNKTQKTNNYTNLYAKSALYEARKILNISEKDLANSGYNVYTYLNNDEQQALYEIVENEKNYGVNSQGNINDSLAVSINNSTGGISALAGKSKYDLVNFERQPGSAIKPVLVFAPALEEGLINSQTQINDEEINFNGYSPHNIGNTYHGFVSVEESISKSLNIPAVKVLETVGIEKAKNFAQRCGIYFSKTDNGHAIALGGFTSGLTLTSLANSFLPFANEGKFKNATLIKQITDQNGKIIYENLLPQKQVMGEDTAFLMTEMLIDGVKNGTSKKLSPLPYAVAGKTGTVCVPGTNYNSDAISVAYTTDHTVATWIGNYSNEKEFYMESNNNGGTFATNLIKLYMEKIYSEKQPENFKTPNSVEMLEIDAKALAENHVVELAAEHCPERYRKSAYFSKRYLPKTTSQLFSDLFVSNFDVSLNDRVASIKFEAKDYFDYEVIKVINNKETLLRTIDNFKGEYTMTDSNLPFSEKIYYYVKVKNTFSDIYNTSDSIMVITPPNNSQHISLLDKLREEQKNKKSNTNLSWYFA